MSSDDEIVEQIQQNYQSHQGEPCNPVWSLAIAKLYEQRKEYANAIPWLQNAFDLGGRTDALLERRILNLSIRAAEQDLAELKGAVNAQTDLKVQVGYQEALEMKLKELAELLRARRQRESEGNERN